MPTNNFTRDSDSEVAATTFTEGVADSQVAQPLPTVDLQADAFVGEDNQFYRGSDSIVEGTLTFTRTSDAVVAEDIPSPPAPPPPGPSPIVPPGPPPEPAAEVRAFFGSGDCNISDCFPCNVVPTTNASAETPDRFSDFVMQWGNIQINTPPLGSPFSSNGCQRFCESFISPELAFFCAQIGQAQCMHDKWEGDPQPSEPCLSDSPCEPGLPIPKPDFPVFFNQQDSCNALCADGLPFTFTVAAGSFAAENQIKANRIASSYACRQAVIHKTCLNLVRSFCCVDQPSTLTFIASGLFVGPGNFWQVISGNLPPGFTFGAATAGPVLPIQGTPTALGDFDFVMRVTAANGNHMEKAFTVNVIGITNADPLMPANEGVAYTVQLVAAGVSSDANWVLFGGELPNGLEINTTTGEISGTPTESGDFTFTAAVTSQNRTCEKVFHLTVGPCFIDASPVLTLTGPANPFVSRTGGLVSFENSLIPNLPWYYLAHVFQQNGLSLGAIVSGENTLAAAGRYLAGTENDGAGSHNVWIDLDTTTIRDLGVIAPGQPVAINDNGDLALSGAQSRIYTAMTDSFSADLMAADGFVIMCLNNNRDCSGTKVVGGQDHAFYRSAAGVYVDLHPGASGAGISSFPGGASNLNRKNINAAGHVVGYFTNAGAQQVFANFGGASIFITAVVPGGIGRAFINDADQLCWNDVASGECFFYQGGLTLSFGIQGVLRGMNSAGLVVGNNATDAWIYRRGITIGFGPPTELLMNFVPNAAADGWTSLKTVFDISDDNFVTGIGVKNGVNTPYVAKLCL